MPRSKAEPDEAVTLTLPKRLLAALYESVKLSVARDSFPAGQEKAGRELAAYLAARFPYLAAADEGRQP